MKNKHERELQVWRVWLRLHYGGIMAIPFPADNLKRAEELRDEAALMLQGHALWLEYMGAMSDSTLDITIQPEPPKKCPFCYYQREGCKGTETGEPCGRYRVFDI